MGTRVNYIIMGTDGIVGAVLFSNSHHELDPQDVFERIIMESQGPTSALRALLAATYPTSMGGHRAGDNIFIIDLHPHDRELVVQATFSDTLSMPPRIVTMTAEEYDVQVMNKAPRVVVTVSNGVADIEIAGGPVSLIHADLDREGEVLSADDVDAIMAPEFHADGTCDPSRLDEILEQNRNQLMRYVEAGSEDAPDNPHP